MSNGRVLSIGNNIVSQTAGCDVAKRHNEATEVMFADVISMGNSFRTENCAFDKADEIISKTQSDKLDTSRENVSDTYEKYQYKEKTVYSEIESETKQTVEEIQEELKSFSEEATKVLKEELHVTEDEIIEAMEELGLQFMDLLNTSNLAKLVVKLGGSEKVNQLLCNEAFTNVLQKVNELRNEMLEKLQMTIEDLQKTITSEKANFTETLRKEGIKTFLDEIVTKSDNQLSQETKTDSEQKGMVEVEDFRAVSEKSGQLDMENGQMAQDDLTEDEGFGKTDVKQMPQNGEPKPGENTIFDTTLSETSESGFGKVTVESLPSYVSVTDIMEQFVEHTKVTLSAEVTKMEMQLNPEHLGKLYLEVTESEGAVTAKIQTQNAIVKEALELQIADLKQNLNQAGVKVDAIEVTIASHEFERNLEQDENSKKQQEDKAQERNRHHNINLNNLDELSGVLSEEEELSAKMMAEQGNSVDLTA